MRRRRAIPTMAELEAAMRFLDAYYGTKSTPPAELGEQQAHVAHARAMGWRGLPRTSARLRRVKAGADPWVVS